MADEAVCVVRLDGSCTGRVGDLGLGLTKPMPLDGNVWIAAGFFVVDPDALPAVSLGAAAVMDFSVAVSRVLRSVVLLAGFVLAALGTAGLFGLVGVLVVGVLAMLGDLTEGFALALTVEMALGALFPAFAAIGLWDSLPVGPVPAALGRRGMEEVAAVVRGFEGASLDAPLVTPFGRAAAGAAGWLAVPFLGASLAFLAPLAAGADAGASSVFFGVLAAGSLSVLLAGLANSFLVEGVGDLSLWMAFVSRVLIGDFSFFSLSLRSGVGADTVTSAGGWRFGVAS